MSLFQVVWEENGLISRLAEHDLWWEFSEGCQQKSVTSIRHSRREGRGLRATEHLLQKFRVADRLRRWHYPNALAKILSHSSPQWCAQKKPREQKEEKILVSSSVVAKGTQSAFLCCDWIIILLLIHVACMFPPWTVFRVAKSGVPCCRMG